MLRSEDIEALERATLQAVAPARIEALPGWLLPMDPGTVSRARSAVPLRHDRPQPDDAARIVRAYRDAGFEPEFRLPDALHWQPFQAVLAAQGFARYKPVQVMTATVAAMLAVPVTAAGELAPRPDPAWTDVFLGEGFDPVDGASRAQSLARAQGCLYASARDGSGRTVAVGMASFGQGWLGIHGMRTLAPARGRGLASGILHAMAQAAQERGITRAFLQVETGNPAIGLYRRFGFSVAWHYAYWRLERH